MYDEDIRKRGLLCRARSVGMDWSDEKYGFCHEVERGNDGMGMGWQFVS